MDNEFNLSEIRRWWIPGNHEVYKVIDDKQNILYRKYFFITYSDSGGLTYKEFSLIYNSNSTKPKPLKKVIKYSTNPDDENHRPITVETPGRYTFEQLPTKPGYAGYYTDRWNTLADGNGDTYKPGRVFEQLTSNIVLYLVWYTYVLLTEDGYKLTMALNTNPLVGIYTKVGPLYDSNKKLTLLHDIIFESPIEYYLDNTMLWVKRGNSDYQITLRILTDYMINRLNNELG